jgi:sigma-B regulation protein RsbU (phosphoserine phosphatase)
MIADGESTGVLVVDSREPRHFQESELRLLRLMANQAALAIEKARLHEEELQRQRLDEELAVARKIQLSMLPAHCPTPVGWQFARYFEAAHQVAGDFYDFLVLPGEPGRLGIVVADVSDKGVPAALFMALSRTTIRNVALRGRTPREVLTWANRFIQEDSQSDMFLTAFYGELDTQNGRMTYANAGHNPPLIWRQALSRFELLNPTGALLGVIEDVQFPEKTVELGHGDVLIIYTDGITEAYADDFTEFGLRRLRDVVTSLFEDSPDASAETILDAIQDAVRGFVGSTLQYDDMTLLVVRRV